MKVKIIEPKRNNIYRENLTRGKTKTAPLSKKERRRQWNAAVDVAFGNSTQLVIKPTK